MTKLPSLQKNQTTQNKTYFKHSFNRIEKESTKLKIEQSSVFMPLLHEKRQLSVKFETIELHFSLKPQKAKQDKLRWHYIMLI